MFIDTIEEQNRASALANQIAKQNEPEMEKIVSKLNNRIDFLIETRKMPCILVFNPQLSLGIQNYIAEKEHIVTSFKLGNYWLWTFRGMPILGCKDLPHNGIKIITADFQIEDFFFETQEV